MIGSHSHGATHICGEKSAAEKNPHGQLTDKSIRNISMAFLLNLVFAVIELVGGWWTNSVAIQADAIHDFGDSMVLLAALGLQWLSAAGARGRYTFGFRRFSLLSALISSLVLFFGSLFIVITAVERILNPEMPHLDGMLWLALLGVVVNGFAAWKIGHGHTHNERALSWHMIEDLLGWIAVLIGSVVMRFVHAPWLDPAMSLVIAGFIILGSIRNMWASSQLFLQAAPALDFANIASEITAINGVNKVLSLKSWSLDGFHHVASLHVSVSAGLDYRARSEIKKQVRDTLERFGEFDLTIEMDES